MTRQMNFKPTADQPLANAYFGTFAFLQLDNPTPENAKEPKFSSRTADANDLSTGSVQTDMFLKNKLNIKYLTTFTNLTPKQKIEYKNTGLRPAFLYSYVSVRLI